MPSRRESAWPASPSPSVKARRERGRNAQAAFRQRQIDTIKLQDEQLGAITAAVEIARVEVAKLRLLMEMAESMQCDVIRVKTLKPLVDKLGVALSGNGGELGFEREKAGVEEGEGKRRKMRVERG